MTKNVTAQNLGVFEDGGRGVQSSIEVINEVKLPIKLIPYDRGQVVLSYGVPYVRIGVLQSKLRDFISSPSKKSNFES